MMGLHSECQFQTNITAYDSNQIASLLAQLGRQIAEAFSRTTAVANKTSLITGPYPEWGRPELGDTRKKIFS